MIIGASGSLGTYAIKQAKYYGDEITAICSSKNFELVKSKAADKKINYTKENFKKNQVK